MKNIELTVSDTEITKTVSQLLRSGMVNDVGVVFDFSSEWDDYTGKTAVFTGSGVSKTVAIISNDAIPIPWECVVSAHGMLKIGIVGIKADGTAHPTLYARLGEIYEGADIDADPAAEPTATLAEQILAKFGNLSELHTDNITTLVAAVNEIYDGAVKSIVKTDTTGLIDTYTITYGDDTSATFTVTNGAKGDAGAAGIDGLTTSITLNEVSYTQTNGIITLPDLAEKSTTYTKEETNTNFEPKKVATTITLIGSEWSVVGYGNYTQRINISSVTPTNTVFVSPDYASTTNWEQFEIKCIVQDEGSLVFASMGGFPEDDVVVQVVIFA